VLDRELVGAFLGKDSAQDSAWDRGEMTFAAACLSELKKGQGDDQRLAHAVHFLSQAVSDRGRFELGRPFLHLKGRGLLVVSQADIIKALSGLGRYTCAVPINNEFAQKLLRFFEETKVNLLEVQKNDLWQEGWCGEYASPPQEFDPMETAAAVAALAEVNNMLDERINEIILKYFTVKHFKKDDVDLDRLFYPDYGLQFIPESLRGVAPEAECPDRLTRNDSIAIILQKMRAHVMKVPLSDALCSLVLHGPAGTGKTTLVEALAKSSGVPMIEVTPSDLVVKGEAEVESRARAVFESLTLLTRVVILFDEFDPVLWRREPEKGPPANVFGFLTPGMLPKLKDLRKEAKKRSTVFVLCTNLIGCLDPAAVRKGRFDEKIGIYPPEPAAC
jgi:hypothetical protein